MQGNAECQRFRFGLLNPTNGSWWIVQILSTDDANKNLLTLCAENQSAR